MRVVFWFLASTAVLTQTSVGQSFLHMAENIPPTYIEDQVEHCKSAVHVDGWVELIGEVHEGMQSCHSYAPSTLRMEPELKEELREETGTDGVGQLVWMNREQYLEYLKSLIQGE